MRSAQISRETKETKINITIDLDGGEVDISTGIGFFDHMLTAFAVHGGFGLSVEVSGDLEVDCHHTIEDTGIVLGKAFDKVLGDKGGIKRFGSFYVPMDEALGFCSLDISGRPFLVYDAGGPMAPMIGNYDTELTEEFLRAFAFNAGITLHVKVMYGTNSHHKVEAIFKALGHALRTAVKIDPEAADEIPSTKGML